MIKMIIVIVILLIAPFANVNTPEDCDKLIYAGIEAMNNKDHTKSLELLTRARSVAEENNWYKQLFLSINNIGANYYSMLDYGEALDNYLAAYTIAIKNLNEEYEMIVLNNIAVLYSKEKQFDKAEEYFIKAYNLAKNKRMDVRIGMYAMNLGIVANERNQPDVATRYLEEAQQKLKDEPELLAQSDLAVAENLLLKGNYREAGNIATKILSSTDDKYEQVQLSALLILSRINQDKGNTAFAISFAKEALRKPVTLEDKIIIYERLAELYIKSDYYQAALEAKDSIIQSSEELNHVKNGRFFETNRVKFEIQNYQKELQKNQQEIAAGRKAFFGVLAISIIVIFLIAWALRNSYIKNKQRKIIQERSREIFNLELEKKQTDNLLLEKQLKEKETLALLEEEKLRNEIENKNRKLAAKALRLTHRNELIEDIIVLLSGQSEISDNGKLREHVQQLRNHLKNDSEWDSFLTHFEEVNYGFITSLKEKHPILTSNDVRFLSYVYINLSNKEISLLLNITPEACRKRKERITNKMELPENADLFNYLSGISTVNNIQNQ